MKSKAIFPIRAAVLAVLPAMFLVISCLPVPFGGRMALVADPHTDEWLRRRGLDDAFLRRGSRLVMPVPDAATLERLLPRAIRPGRSTTVVLAASRLENLAAMAEAYPGVRFVVLEGFGPGLESLRPLPANVWEVRFDRREAFRRCGRAAGRLLAGPGRDGQPGLPPGGEGEAPPGAAVLFLEPTRQDRQEAEAFREGLAATAPTARLLSREIADPDDREGLRRTLEELRGLGARIFLLKTYTLSSFSLENLAQAGDWAVVEDWAAAGYGSAAVLFSVERDLPGSWKRIAAAAPGKDGQEPGALDGPVEIVTGRGLDRLGPQLGAAVVEELGQLLAPAE